MPRNCVDNIIDYVKIVHFFDRDEVFEINLELIRWRKLIVKLNFKNWYKTGKDFKIDYYGKIKTYK